MTQTLAAAGPNAEPVGTLLRDWRQRRRLSQLELALRAEVSPRHVSRVEGGLVRPTSSMILRLSDQLEIPLREQNRLLLAGGHAPVHAENPLDSPPMAEVHRAVSSILAAHLPWPALVVDRHWELVDANEAVYGLLDGVDADLLEPPVNVIRLSVHPRGLAPRIVDLDQWRGTLAHRLAHEYDAAADPEIKTLLADLRASGPCPPPSGVGLVVPFRVRRGDRVLSFLSTTTVFGTAREITLAELAIEAFYPADAATREALGAG